MNHKTAYRKSLAAAMLLLIFVIDLVAVYELFPNFLQVTLFGAILGIQTLLILAYHQRCMECVGCMEKAGAEIYMFYKVFAVIGCFSVLIILLPNMASSGNVYLQIIAAITYAVLLMTGISTAFKAVIGVRNFSGCRESESGDESARVEKEPEMLQRQAASMQEQKTLEAWQLAEEKRRAKSQQIQQRQKAERKNARLRAKNASRNGVKFKFPDVPKNFH